MLEELKQALSDIGYEATDALASLALSLTTEKILNYCNLEELPEALHYTALEIDVYKRQIHGYTTAPSWRTSAMVGWTLRTKR